MEDKKVVETIEDIKEKFGKLPKEIEDVAKDPIIEPIKDYLKYIDKYDSEEDRENEYLEKVKKELDILLEHDVYENSKIANTYRRVLEVMERLLWIYSNVAKDSSDKMIEIKEVVDKKYISKAKHEEEIKKLIKDLKEKKNEKDRKTKRK